MAGAKGRRLTRDSVRGPSGRGHVSECTCYGAAFAGMPEEGTATSWYIPHRKTPTFQPARVVIPLDRVSRALVGPKEAAAHPDRGEELASTRGRSH
jgi:hypothetical protein